MVRECRKSGGRWRIWLAICAVVLLISGCSDDDTDDILPTPEATATTSPAPPADATTTSEPTETADEPAPAESPPPSVTETPSPPEDTPNVTPDEQPLFDPEAVTLEVEPVAEGFNEPLYVTHAGDGNGRLFVVERGGSIRLLTGELLLDITQRVGSEGTEQGLLGLAFHPSFAENGWLYVNYTDLNGDTVISRFSMTDDVIDPESEYVILTQEQPASNHNGGMVLFGPDGYLYIGLGDGGRSYDAFDNAQNLDSLLGKLLRIDVDGGEDPYGIPPDNPFVGVDGARPEIWAYGLRNPWRFSFDRATNGLYIADVGQNAYEWVHFQPGDSVGGENYGWPIFEGDACLIEERCGEEGFVEPIVVYGREGGCAIIGGFAYRGEASPALQGAYLFGDLCSGNIWATARDGAGEWQTTLMLQIDVQLSSFGEDENGELYVTDLSGGRVFRIVTR